LRARINYEPYKKEEGRSTDCFILQPSSFLRPERIAGARD